LKKPKELENLAYSKQHKDIACNNSYTIVPGQKIKINGIKIVSVKITCLLTEFFINNFKAVY
jgi:hypothetical protein